VLVDNRVRIEWKRSTQDKNWKWCLGDGDRGDPGDRQAGEGGALYHRKQKTGSIIDIFREGTRVVKEVAPELTTVSAVVGQVLVLQGPRQKEVVETVCAMSKRDHGLSLAPL
jgi:hypothetical protein